MYQQTKVGSKTSVCSLATDQLQEMPCNLTEKGNTKPRLQSQHEILFRPKNHISTPFKDFFEIVNQEFQRKMKIPAERIRILQSQFEELSKQLHETEAKLSQCCDSKTQLRFKIIELEEQKRALLAQGKQEKIRQTVLLISDVQSEIMRYQISQNMYQKIFYGVLEKMKANENAIKDSEIVLAKLEAKRALFLFIR